MRNHSLGYHRRAARPSTAMQRTARTPNDLPPSTWATPPHDESESRLPGLPDMSSQPRRYPTLNREHSFRELFFR
ncbi:hypothetical protein RMSM_02573 [Rhodopirellula maiorica SM1]|uniref:Uncharacterized protein n=1 Tax=Rhodopirellula maiorica SM1 TaxID=1265738 RepID=M5RMG8_9BACT|nr:hypothetical protein RMSM_02573 [Rhodopirellula maiorica SM1]